MLDRPVAIWLVEALGEAHAASDMPVFGREMELSQLAAALAAARRQDAGAVLRLRGEAGIGKTRLVRALLTMAAQEAVPAHAATNLDFGVERGRDAARQLASSLLSLGRNAASADRASSPFRCGAAR